MSAPAPSRPRSLSDLVKLSLGALGVVYGDIGTSPLYALRECFAPPHGLAVTERDVLGILSLFFWSLTLIIVVKYLGFVMRADNEGEGGTFALIALLDPNRAERTRGGRALVLLGLFGAALLGGEGIITPAISVLGAVEGLKETTDAFEPIVVPLSVAILLGLFLIQKRGTGGVGAVFGPAMVVWFGTIAAIGVPWIVRRPDVLWALNPGHAVDFMWHHRGHGFLVLGSVVLCFTGGEALYADMGHFGKGPIRIAWYACVFPALLANYFGQGALLMEKGAVPHSFFGLVDGWVRVPLVIVATAAAVIASQALIAGCFSLARAAIQLGFLPRLKIVHTSGTSEGQIYVPEVNWVLCLACLAFVVGFGSASKLAAAYGISVTGTMTITSLLLFAVARWRWRWSVLAAGSLATLFLVVDLSFFAANLVKLPHGGWVSLAIGGVVFVVMTTWRRGRALLAQEFSAQTLPLQAFMDDLRRQRLHRVPGTAVFMTSNPKGAPPTLLHHFKHNKVFHEQVILLSIAARQVPEVKRSERLAEIENLGNGFWRVTASYGFMQTPNVLEVLGLCASKGLVINENDTSYFLGRETLIITSRPNLARWRKLLFAFLSRNARPANAFFQIPANRVVELGTQIEL
jgi:KUP system potassium uptake protein